MDGSVCGILTVLFLVTLHYLARQSADDELVEAAPAWIEFARRHELRYNELNIWGRFKGYALRVDTEQHKSTRSKFNLTRLVFAVPALPRTVLIEPDYRFNEFPIRQEHATPEVTALLQHPSVRERFSVAANTYREFTIQNGHISAQRNGRVPVTVEELESFIEPAFQLARALDEAARSGTPTSRSG
ncbi:hypothetical protein [Pyxidicoccus sp. MSG2]|uniref:hypothetical protein n=1 Tax=Pyxidicoccus sp. MSG2 TaxID=2996790 RepID=UPI00226D910C|nr:hypothetical protein [Pyxidicoccus sp. MSG2]MCY1023862.1 hypothetical protein [Pyxidicoccus sp. MSG2]